MLGRAGATPPPPVLSTLCGTPEYLAPEILLGMPCTEAVDVWSLGCLTCELLCGASPFAHDDCDIEEFLRNIIAAPISLPDHGHIGTVENDFLLALLTREPVARLGARPRVTLSILQHMG